jgi:hypothetical protein
MRCPENCSAILHDILIIVQIISELSWTLCSHLSDVLTIVQISPSHPYYCADNLCVVSAAISALSLLFCSWSRRCPGQCPKRMRFPWNNVKIEGIRFHSVKMFTLWNLIPLFVKMLIPLGTVYMAHLMYNMIWPVQSTFDPRSGIHSYSLPYLEYCVLLSSVQNMICENDLRAVMQILELISVFALSLFFPEHRGNDLDCFLRCPFFSLLANIP